MKKRQVIKLAQILLLVMGLGMGIVAVGKKTGIRSMAKEQTHRVGQISGMNLYRRVIKTGWDYGEFPWDSWSMVENAAPMYAVSVQAQHGTYDPKANKTYLVYPAGILKIDGNEYSAYEPYVTAYNHTNNMWEGPVKLFSSDVYNGFAPTDNHKVGQIIVDRDGYLHVFYTWHTWVFGWKNIYHFVSKQPGNISDWERKEIPKTSGSTYGAAFVDQQGEIYLFFRQSMMLWDANSNYMEFDCMGRNPCIWYEPERYVKSTDNGKTWQGPFWLVDSRTPGNIPDGVMADGKTDRRKYFMDNFGYDISSADGGNKTGWLTIYVKDVEYDYINNRLYFTFSPHKYHNDASGPVYVALFDFVNDRVMTVDGSRYYQPLRYPVYGTELRFKLADAATVDNNSLDIHSSQAIIVDNAINNRIPYRPPIVFFNNYCPKVPETICRLMRADWDLSNSRYRSRLASGVSDWRNDPFTWVAVVFDGRRNSDRSIDLVVKSKKEVGGGNYPVPGVSGGWPEAYKYSYRTKWYNNRSGRWEALPLLADHLDWEIRGLSRFQFIEQPHPQIFATAVRPAYDAEKYQACKSNITNCLPIGVHYVFGNVSMDPPEPAEETNIQNSCKSYETLRIDNCPLAEWNKTPTGAACLTESKSVWLKNTIQSATKVRYAEISDIFDTWCNQLSDNDSHWGAWEDVSLYRYWELSPGSGRKKVCAQYKNHKYQSTGCGGTIQYSESASVTLPTTNNNLVRNDWGGNQE